MDFAETWTIRKLSSSAVSSRDSTAWFAAESHAIRGVSWSRGFALVILSMKGLPNGQRPSWLFDGTYRYDKFFNGRYGYVTERPLKAV